MFRPGWSRRSAFLNKKRTLRVVPGRSPAGGHRWSLQLHWSEACFEKCRHFRRLPASRAIADYCRRHAPGTFTFYSKSLFGKYSAAILVISLMSPIISMPSPASSLVLPRARMK